MSGWKGARRTFTMDKDITILLVLLVPGIVVHEVVQRLEFTFWSEYVPECLTNGVGNQMTIDDGIVQRRVQHVNIMLPFRVVQRNEFEIRISCTDAKTLHGLGNRC